MSQNPKNIKNGIYNIANKLVNFSYRVETNDIGVSFNVRHGFIWKVFNKVKWV